MAIEFTHSTVDGDITVKWQDGGDAHEIWVDAAISDLLVQDLVNACREAEESEVGAGFPQIARASGKDNLGPGVATGITLELLGDWRVYSQKTTGVFRVLGGNLIKGDGSDPFKPNNLITHINILSANSTIVQTGEGGGSGDGFGTNDREKLNAVHAVTEDLEGTDALVTAIWSGEGGIRGTLQGLLKTLKAVAASATTILQISRNIQSKVEKEKR